MTRPHWFPAYIGVGGNLDDPICKVSQGIDAIGELPGCILVSRSSLFRSSPMGPADQPDFVNAVAGILTTLSAEALLGELLALEDASGRNRDTQRWGPRVLDLDLLAYSDHCLQTDSLVIPHPGVADRNFVLYPWCQLAPHFKVPGHARVATLCAAVSTQVPAIETIDQENVKCP